MRSIPLVYAPNGGTYYKGDMIWATSGGGIQLPDGSHPRPGLYAVNATTGVARTLLNNFSVTMLTVSMTWLSTTKVISGSQIQLMERLINSLVMHRNSSK
jgi:hypothetical protein